MEPRTEGKVKEKKEKVKVAKQIAKVGLYVNVCQAFVTLILILVYSMYR